MILAPWVEQNQGLISVAALGFALAAFLVEQRRANAEAASSARAARYADLKALEARVMAAYGVIDTVTSVTERAAKLASTGNDIQVLMNERRKRISEAAEAIDIFSHAAPFDAGICLALTRIERELKEASSFENNHASTGPARTIQLRGQNKALRDLAAEMDAALERRGRYLGAQEGALSRDLHLPRWPWLQSLLARFGPPNP